MRNDTALSYLYNSLESQQAALDFVKMSNDPSILLISPCFNPKLITPKRPSNALRKVFPFYIAGTFTDRSSL